jgi:phage-related protein
MNIRIFDEVSRFLDSIPEEHSAKILAHLNVLQEHHTEGLLIKPLKGKVMELVVQQYRIIFFRIGATGYVIDAFKKQSRKTPKRSIERAEKIYKSIAH